MAKKKLKTNGIFFTGKSADDVTGSQYYIKYGDTSILIECGLHQSASNDYLDSYKINSEKFQFTPSNLDYVFVAHAHIDHCGLIPKLVKDGFHGKIITTGKTAMIMKPLLYNSCAIVKDEARVLSKRYHRNYEPLYCEDDVAAALDLMYEYDEYNKIYCLDEHVSFQWIRNSHCVGAAQLQLILHDGAQTKRILYSSDIGSLKPKNHYVGRTIVPEMFNDVSIMESTYGAEQRPGSKKRSFDVSHLRAAIDTVLARNGTVILPCFSFSRTQEVLTTLYEIYGEQKDFCAPILIDSKLSCDICKLYSQILEGNALSQWNKICEWDNVHFIEEKEESRTFVADKRPKVVISSSGFCTNGRVISYLKEYVKDRNSMIVFTGFTGDNSSYLSYRIKNSKGNRSIKINGDYVQNRADCICLSSFSSHAGREDLLEYGSSLNTNKLVLVHGSKEAKKSLSESLREEISKKNKSFKVVESCHGMVVHL